MPFLRPRTILSLLIGYVVGRHSSILDSQVSGFDIRVLSEELTNTRLALRAVSGEDLKSEIRHSAALSIPFRGVLFVEFLLLVACSPSCRGPGSDTARIRGRLARCIGVWKATWAHQAIRSEATWQLPFRP